MASAVTSLGRCTRRSSKLRRNRVDRKMSDISTILLLLLLIFTSPAHAWSNDERSYPSNDAATETEEESTLQVKSSVFQLQLHHPWTADPILTPSTIKSAQPTVQTVLHDVLNDHFAGSYLSLPFTGDAVRIGQYQSIEVNCLPTDTFESIEKATSTFKNSPQCPCSLIPLQATAYFALISAISPSLGNRRIEESDNNDLLRSFLDDLIITLMAAGSPGASLLESELQTAVAVFSEGQGFAARIIPLVDTPTPMPTKASIMQAPPLRSSPSPAPTPTSGIINGITSDSSTQPAGSGERTIFLIGAILGACFFAAAFLLLRRADIRRNHIVEQHKSSNDPDDSIEEIEFYPNHLRPTPPSYTSAYTEKDNEPTRLPGCMSMEFSSDYLFNDQITNVYGDTTPKASNKAKSTTVPRAVKCDGLDAPSQSIITPQRHLFEVKSLDDLDPLQPPSAVFAKRQYKVVEPLQPSSTSFSVLDSVWSSFDGWSTCSWPSNNPSPAEKSEPIDGIADIPGSSGQPPKNPSSAEHSKATETKLSNASVSMVQTVGIEPPGAIATTLPNDDGSFHGSVESFDSLISSCWDPNDNSTGDAMPEGSGPPAAESSSTTSVLADDVSFYPHIKFMANPKMLRWAERARKSLAVVNATKVVSSVESLVTSAADQMASDEKLSGEHPYLSVSFSNSIESSFDENGFKVVSNPSTVV